MLDYTTAKPVWLDDEGFVDLKRIPPGTPMGSVVGPIRLATGQIGHLNPGPDYFAKRKLDAENVARVETEKKPAPLSNTARTRLKKIRQQGSDLGASDLHAEERVLLELPVEERKQLKLDLMRESIQVFDHANITVYLTTLSTYHLSKFYKPKGSFFHCGLYVIDFHARIYKKLYQQNPVAFCNQYFSQELKQQLGIKEK